MNLSKLKIFLQLFAIVHILGGISLPFLVNTPLFAPYNLLLYEALGLGATEQTSNINFLVGLFGPTIASWGVLFLYIVTVSFENPDKRGWWAMFLWCIAWAPYDSLLSIYQGIYINALINLISASAILIPLFIVRQHFFSPQHSSHE